MIQWFVNTESFCADVCCNDVHPVEGGGLVSADGGRCPDRESAMPRQAAPSDGPVSGRQVQGATWPAGPLFVPNLIAGGQRLAPLGKAVPPHPGVKLSRMFFL